jgi:hypothetical protein
MDRCHSVAAKDFRGEPQSCIDPGKQVEAGPRALVDLKIVELTSRAKTVKP